MHGKLEDGVPNLVPPAGKGYWLYWYVDGAMSPRIIEIVPALPVGSYHLCTMTGENDDGSDTYVDWISKSPVLGRDLEVWVPTIAESKHEGVHQYLWLPPMVVGADRPSVEHPRRHEFKQGALQ